MLKFAMSKIVFSRDIALPLVFSDMNVVPTRKCSSIVRSSGRPAVASWPFGLPEMRSNDESLHSLPTNTDSKDTS